MTPPGADEAWIVETSRDGQNWRFFGKAWVRPGESLMVHGLPAFLRFRRDGADQWSPPLERTGDHPVALITLDPASRRELWPEETHRGLPVLLPGGEEGRLLRFEHSADGSEWTWALEFRGRRREISASGRSASGRGLS
ncbi:hypothetical protein EPN29_10960 [bacterium]|nr:MAG: hypothetical protein EPN29_10960 [bacterium]